MAKAPRTKVNADDMLDLTVAVEQLAEETRLLRTSLDELRDDVVWSARQVLAAGDVVAPGQLRRQYDPLAPETTPPDADDEPIVTPLNANPSGDSPESSESPTYCCDRPNLRWHGDPDAPGIACASCGYLVAEQGSVVIWRDEYEKSDNPRLDPPAEPQQRQGNLFEAG